MLILILINVQHSRKAVFSFEKGSNHQNHSSSGSRPSKIFDPSHWGGGIYPPSLPTPYCYLENPAETQ